MEDPLENYPVYNKASELYDSVMDDTDLLMNDVRGIEISKQVVRSAGSICASIEEGLGRGYYQEFIRYLRISRGCYKRSKKFLDFETRDQRIKTLNEITAILTSMINNMEKSKEEK